MAWNFKGRLRRVPPRRFTAGFHARRALAEGFSKSYVEPSPVYGLAKAVLAHPVGFSEFYYMSLAEYTGLILEWAREAGERVGWEAVAEVLRTGRRVGLSKDPPLVAAHALPGWAYAASTLELYPVSKLRLWLHMARKQGEIGVRLGYGERKRRAVSEALARHEPRWHELQAAKSPRPFRELLRMAHPRPPSREVEEIWGYVVGRREPPTEMLRLAEDLARGRVSGVEALARALDTGAPWELVRSRVGLGGVPETMLREAAVKLMTPWDLAMQARSLADRLGEDEVISIVRARASQGRGVPASAAARAALGLAGRYLRLAEEMAEVARRGAARLWGELERRGLAVPMEGTRYLVDVSDSMRGGPIKAAARILLALGVDEVYVFNDCIGVRRVELRGLDDYLRLAEMPSCGTPLYDSIAWMAERVVEKGEVLVVLTDEQENASTLGVDDLSGVLRGVEAIIVNPAPYSADYVPKQPLANVVGLPGSSPDAVIAGAVILGLTRAQSEGVADERLVEAIVRAAAEAKSL